MSCYVKGYWNKQKCLDIGKTCKSKKEFKEKYPGAYTASRRNGWLDDIWKNMSPLGSRFNRCIYAYEFPDNHVYIGLTFNLTQRDKRHHLKKYNSIVLQYEEKTGKKPILKQLTDYLDKDKASILEGDFIESYKQEGWIILNKAKPGSLGGNTILWTKENCLKAALTCKTKNEFLRKFRGAHNAAKLNGWLDELQNHMDEVIKPKNYWTKERCSEISLKCKSKSEMKKLSISAYTVAYRNGWLNDICSHMK